jgi:mono/diheme cytochrome c family protein
MRMIGLAFGLLSAASAFAATPADILRGFQAQGAAAVSAPRGERFFTSRHGSDWSCSTCHTDNPLARGRHATTGKAIAPLAPASNAERFTDARRVEKWFRRNCNDVLGRACSAQEKADVLGYLMSLGRGGRK